MSPRHHKNGQITKGRLLNMKLKTAKGEKEYKTKELDFTNVMCDLEDKGVDVMAMINGDFTNGGKLFSTLRILISALIDEPDLKKAGSILSEHLANGGDMDVILNTFTEVMAKAGFGEAATEEENPSETA